MYTSCPLYIAVSRFICLVGSYKDTITFSSCCSIYSSVLLHTRTCAGRVERVLVSAFPCKLNSSNSSNSSNSLDVELHICPETTVCEEWPEGPNWGITSFDDFAVSFVTVFQVMSLEGWAGIFYLVKLMLCITYAVSLYTVSSG